MAYSIGANSGRINYGIKHYNLDTAQDLVKLPRFKLPRGCTCFVIETSKHYMLNGNHQWIEIHKNSGGSDSSDDDFIYDGGLPDDETPDDVIYEGGII